MTETTVPRVAKFDDLRVGMTIERVWRDSSYGRKVTHEGIVGRVLPFRVVDERGGRLYSVVDDDDPRVTLRILSDEVAS